MRSIIPRQHKRGANSFVRQQVDRQGSLRQILNAKPGSPYHNQARSSFSLKMIDPHLTVNQTQTTLWRSSLPVVNNRFACHLRKFTQSLGGYQITKQKKSQNTEILAQNSILQTTPKGASSVWLIKKVPQYDSMFCRLPRRAHYSKYFQTLSSSRACKKCILSPTQTHHNHSLFFKYNQWRVRSFDNIRTGISNVKPPEYAQDLMKLRNLGIIAHVDAGKTTLAEHMLYYAGALPNIGNVDSGDTFLDYLEMERERGITITSAATKFHWKDFSLNLIDTPGHVDFTIEVERSVRVLDGAVTVLDGTVGVQAQTVTVWKQADRFKVPRIVFINKMDREGANFEKAAETLVTKLGAFPVMMQFPAEEGPLLRQIVDVVRGVAMEWEGERGEIVKTRTLTEGDPLFARAQTARSALLEKLSEFDDMIMEKMLEGSDITSEEIMESVRRLTHESKVVPLFAGSALKNVGVQPVLDAITDFLPHPAQIQATVTKKGQEIPVTIFPDKKAPLCALAFKVIHDKFKGLIVYVRVYSGTLTTSSGIKNMSTGKTERIPKLFQVSANELHSVSEIPAGEIGAIIGIKDIKTGDTLVGLNSDNIQLEKISLPQPVFFRSIEPKTKSVEKQLMETLEILKTEDPSFNVKNDTETGQLLISGMGELHLEIIADRILNYFQVPASIGKLCIAFKVGFAYDVRDQQINLQLEDADQYVSVGMNVSVISTPDQDPTFEIDQEGDFVLGKVEYDQMERSLLSGLQIGVDKGAHGYPFTNVKVIVHSIESPQAASPVIFRRAAARILSTLFRKDPQCLSYLEPVMNVDISTPDEYFGSILSDLTSQRRAIIESLGTASESTSADRTIQAQVPLTEMVGYSTTLRSLTKGTASYVMDFHQYSSLPKIKFDEITKANK